MKTNATTNEYETAANDFLSRNGLKFRITLSDSKSPAWAKEGEDTGHHYRVTISKDKREVFRSMVKEPDRFSRRSLGIFFSKADLLTAKNKLLARSPYYAQCTFLDSSEVIREADRITFDFWGSIADARGNKHPSAYDVLACISGDAYTPETFADFCAEYGYERDSIKALQTFRRADRFAKRLRSFFTKSELSELAEIN